MTGNPDAACMYLTSASTLGRSYALYAKLIVILLSGVWSSRGSLLGNRSKHNSFGIPFSLNPVRMGLTLGKNTVTPCFANKTVQSASQMGPTPTIVLVKDGMMYHVLGKSSTNCGIGSEAVAYDLSTCPVAVPTHFLGYLCHAGHGYLLGKCRGGLRHSLLRQCHVVVDSYEPLPSYWFGRVGIELGGGLQRKIVSYDKFSLM